MNLQEEIIQSYLSKKKKKLREISEETGIQMTRVFRIFNGAEMKISEYELFVKALSEKRMSDEFLSLSKRYLSVASKNELEQMSQVFKREIQKKKLFKTLKRDGHKLVC